MIVVLKHGVTKEKKEQLILWLKALGVRIHISDGDFQTVLGLPAVSFSIGMSESIHFDYNHFTSFCQ